MRSYEEGIILTSILQMRTLSGSAVSNLHKEIGLWHPLDTWEDLIHSSGGKCQPRANDPDSLMALLSSITRAPCLL